MKEITELTITRSKWLRGEGSDESYLLRSKDGKMCCLGMFCLAAGVGQETIKELRTPGNIDYGKFSAVIKTCPPQLSDECGSESKVNQLMASNDSKLISEDEREKAIADLMLKMNPPVKVTFVD